MTRHESGQSRVSVDTKTATHSLEWEADLCEDGTLDSDACLYCGNERIFNIRTITASQNITHGDEAAVVDGATRTSPDMVAYEELIFVRCGRCDAILYDKNAPDNEGPRP